MKIEGKGSISKIPIVLKLFGRSVFITLLQVCLPSWSTMPNSHVKSIFTPRIKNLILH